MKNKLLLLGLLTCVLFSCKEKGEIRSLTLSMPSSFNEATEQYSNISVWSDGVENMEFVFSRKTDDGKLEYRSKQALSADITGRVRVVLPYTAHPQYDGESIVLHQNEVQSFPIQSIYIGGQTTSGVDKSAITMRAMTSYVCLRFTNIPKGIQIVSATLRLSPKEGCSSNLFYNSATYNFPAGRLTADADSQRSAFTTYSTENIAEGGCLYLSVFSEAYNNCNLPAEIITTGENGQNALHLFTLEGKTFVRGQTYEYIIDFNQAHTISTAYCTDALGIVSCGLPIEIEGTTFAPVNLGYDEVLAPFGLLYKAGDMTGLVYHEANPLSEYSNDKMSSALTSIPDGWRLPTTSELQKLVSCERSEGSIAGNTFGWWFAEKLYLEATGCILPDGTSTGRLMEGYYRAADSNNVLHITDDKAQLTEMEDSACAIRLVKE